MATALPIEALDGWEEIIIRRKVSADAPTNRMQRSNRTKTKGKGRGWWGDPDGHAKAGSKSHG